MTARALVLAAALVGCRAPTGPRLPLHPLAVGDRWTYEVTIDRARRSSTPGPSAEPLPVAHHTGTITLTITGQSRRGRAWVLDVATERSPSTLPARTVGRWVAIDRRLFAVPDDRALDALLARAGRDVGLAEVLVDPPESRARWGLAPGIQPDYGWRLAGRRSLDTVAGRRDACAIVTYVRGPDQATMHYCPDLGLVAADWSHHGTVDHEQWRLLGFRRGR